MTSAVLTGVVVVSLAACSVADPADTNAAAVASGSVTAANGASSDTTTSVDASDAELFDSSVVHSISLDYDETAYQAMIATYESTGEKEWLTATVTIDGTVFSNVGIKLKGNSTLQGLRSAGGGTGNTAPQAGATDSTAADSSATDSTATDSSATDSSAADSTAADSSATDSSAADSTATAQDPAAQGNTGMNRGGGPGGDISADEPEGLPWRIRLDKYVTGQNYQGQTDLVVRGGSSETSLNEAVALELIGAAGLPTEEAISTRFTVNGGAAALRLVIQNPTGTWDEENFDSSGVLYKAEAGGDYSYRGDDATSYADVFSVEASTSGEDDYTPLIDFLKFINESDDATFAAELGSHLDVEAFAKYLAIQDLVANSDDIDGPGNNSYLRYDADTKSFTVVAWDQNLSFSSMGGFGGGGARGAGGPGGDGGPGGAGGTAPTGAFQPPTGTDAGNNAQGRPAGGGMGGKMGGDNILVTRFKANADFEKLYETALTDLRAQLYTSGTAQQILDTWTSVITSQATDLVPAATITAESEAIAQQFTTSS